ncbi:hypothetical protein ACJX0J_011343 [Zea mays]
MCQLFFHVFLVMSLSPLLNSTQTYTIISIFLCSDILDGIIEFTLSKATTKVLFFTINAHQPLMLTRNLFLLFLIIFSGHIEYELNWIIIHIISRPYNLIHYLFLALYFIILS